MGRSPKAISKDELEYLADRFQVDPSSPSGLSYKRTVCPKAQAGSVVGGLHHTGYWRVKWTRNGKYTTRSCHALVLELSGQLCPGEGYEPDHIDRNRENNKIENLRWLNRSDQAFNRTYENKHGYSYVAKYKGKFTYEFYVPGSMKFVKKYGFTTAAEAYAAAVRMREQLGLDGPEV